MEFFDDFTITKLLWKFIMEINIGSLAMDYTINGNIPYMPMRMVLP